ncbi:MAG: hypothetical protein A2X36_09120 [Elusimicrobia bacterium GWA2_69_24]|nr:MAG: hypothetical protein A2X36_09120 [Elusimicrobia bacterium GWA2_69_24]HBL18557.1 carboxylate--amine ligase [Elusimicrobiota bacterium]
MNILFLSPHFPPNFRLFCAALKEEGASVLGIGDAPFDSLDWDLRDSLSEYVQLPGMGDYGDLLRTTAYLISRHGRMDRIDSLNEHWLGLEAQLRLDFNIFGQKPADLEHNRRKSGMKEVFRKAGVPVPAAELVVSSEQVRAFIARHGFPVVFKPDLGVGAVRIFRVDDELQLAGVLGALPSGFVVESFVSGDLVSFDGLVDREGRIVFCASHRVSSGIMEILTERRPVHYCYTREIPPGVEELGRKCVAAFGIRERFFHIEFLIDQAGACHGLEVNVRPPGGLSVDMMNWSCDVDLYRLWARLLVRGEAFLDYRRTHNVAHVARRHGFAYRRTHEEVLRETAPLLMTHMEFPWVFRAAMGDYIYFLRHPDMAVLQKAIDFIEERV